MGRTVRKTLWGFVVGVGLAWFGTTGTATAFVEDTPPTQENGGVDAQRTADPRAVAAAQRVLTEFFRHTNQAYSLGGYANPRVMRETVGNGQDNWLDKTMNLACGRLIGGWHYQNWDPDRGWCHCAPSRPSPRQSGATSCDYAPPSTGNGGVDPNTTLDPPIVAATQEALRGFYRYTNLTYSRLGYSNPQVMREERGNDQTEWLDQSLALARGQLVGGWKGLNWSPGKGWCACSAPLVSVPSSGQAAEQAATLLGVPTSYYAWQTPAQPERVAATSRPRAGRSSPSRDTVDGEARRIMNGLQVNLGGEDDD
jgi:hypothetical protein